MSVIRTKRSAGRILTIAKSGTKRQRAKYKNAYVTLCKNNSYVLGQRWNWEQRDLINDRKYFKAERRNGHALPTFLNSKICEPQWYGVKNMIGMYWTFKKETWVSRN